MQHLFANSNRINDIPDIDKLSELAYLKELELNGNAFSRRPGYRAAVLKKLTTLLYLDGRVRINIIIIKKNLQWNKLGSYNWRKRKSWWYSLNW